MDKEQKNLTLALGNYVLFTALTGLGGYLFVRYPQNEALGGMSLGLTSVLLGIYITVIRKQTSSLPMYLNSILSPQRHKAQRPFCAFLCALVPL